MPTESKLTAALLKLLRQRYPRAVVFKHHELGSAGVPDFSFTTSGRTVWVECKRDKPAVTDIQRMTLGRLHVATEGRALILVFNTKKAGAPIDIYDIHQQLRTGLTQNEAIDYLVGIAEHGDGLTGALRR